MRRLKPSEANRWWFRLQPIEKSVFCWFVRAAQMASPSEALHAMESFRDIDQSMLTNFRKDVARQLRRQKRVARLKQPTAPVPFCLSA